MDNQKNKICFSLNKNFYDINSIKESLEDFKEVCNGEIKNESENSVEILIETEEENIEEIKREFCNYVLSLIKNKPEENIEEIGLENQFIINNYRWKRIGNRILVTTDHGSWIFLSEKEFDLLRKNRVRESKELFELLEDREMIITSKNYERLIGLFRKKYDSLLQGTSLHIVIPTLRCNQKCVYCHASSKPLDSKNCDMNEETAKATVDFIFQSPSQFIAIEFQGGEPLIRFDIVKFIVKYAKELNKKYKKNLEFRLVTNFSLMDEEKMDYLIDEEVGICTSLDGPAELHNKNRPFIEEKGSYYFVEKWIKRLKEKYDKRNIKNRVANAVITITKDSLSKPKEIVDEYVRLELKGIFLRFLNKLGDARPVWENISYTPEEFIEFWKKAIDYLIEVNKKGTRITEGMTIFMLRKINGDEPNYFEQRSPCGAAIGQIAYDSQGNIFTCDEARMVKEDLFKLGNVKKDSYQKIISSNQTCGIVASSINETHICDYCVFKPYCGICPVCNYMEEGNIVGNILSTPRCKIYKAQYSYIFKKLQNPEDRKVLLSWVKKY